MLLLIHLHLILLKVSAACTNILLVVIATDGVAVHTIVVVHLLVRLLLLLLWRLFMWRAVVGIFDTRLIFQNFGSLFAETERGRGPILRRLLRHLVEVVERVVLKGCTLVSTMVLMVLVVVVLVVATMVLLVVTMMALLVMVSIALAGVVVFIHKK